MLWQILLANILISLLSLVGIVFLFRKESAIQNIILGLVGLSTGTLLGGAFFHLIPEGLKSVSVDNALTIILVSYVTFFAIEKVVHWHHCHDEKCAKHSIGYINIIGDLVHNFIDGLIVAFSFTFDVRLGIIATISIAFHEIPQELGDFGVLLHSGFSKKKALLFNYLSALTTVLGGILGFLFISTFSSLISPLLLIAAGGFMYISTSDLIPEIRNETDLRKSIQAFVLFFIGILGMYLFKFL